MKASTLISIIVTAAIAGGAGWFAARRSSVPGDAPAAASTARKVAFYQSPMHPWIKSDHPGRCTICGMWSMSAMVTA